MEKLFADEKIEVVFHLAANSDIEAGSKDHEIDLKLNFLSTYTLLEVMQRHRVKKIFFASTGCP
jgi:UDP-glucose 4-epimerase